MSEKLTPSELAKNLYACRNHIIGISDISQHKHYILPLVFYAEVNRRFEIEYEEELKSSGFSTGDSNVNFDEAIRKMSSDDGINDIQIPCGYSWRQIQNFGTKQFNEDIVDDRYSVEDSNIGAFIDEAFKKFEQKNGEYEGTFVKNYANLTEYEEKDGNNKTKKLVSEIDEIIYEEGKELSQEEMGEAFASLIKYIGESEPGKYFTPKEIVRLTVSMLSPFEEESTFHDPTVGSGGMLIEVANQIRNSFEFQNQVERDNLDVDTSNKLLEQYGYEFTGQEINSSIAGLAKMNTVLNLLNPDVRVGDSITNPRFTENDDELEKFDYVLSNFPFSQTGWKTDAMSRKKQFGDMNWAENGKLPNGNCGDFAFIMHMDSHLDDSGQMATVIPNGVLFRNGDQKYRKHMIENDMVEAVVGLPENLFGATRIPSAILVLNKDKPEEREGEVMFLSADQEDRFYTEETNRNRLLDPIENNTMGVEHVHEYIEMDEPVGNAEIKQLFEKWENEHGVCQVVSTDQIRENEYNMNIALYIDTVDSLNGWKRMIPDDFKLEESKKLIPLHSIDETQKDKVVNSRPQWALWSDKYGIETGTNETQIPSEILLDSDLHDISFDSDSTKNNLIINGGYSGLSYLRQNYEKEAKIVYANMCDIKRDTYVESIENEQYLIDFFDAVQDVTRKDGAIFTVVPIIRVPELSQILDKTYGRENRFCILQMPVAKSSNINTNLAVLVYCRDNSHFEDLHSPLRRDYERSFPERDKKGMFRLENCVLEDSEYSHSNLKYSIETPEGQIISPSNDYRFRISEERFRDKLNQDEILFKRQKNKLFLTEDGNKSDWDVYYKKYAHNSSEIPDEIIDTDVLSTCENCEERVKCELDLIKYLISMCRIEKSDTVLCPLSKNGLVSRSVIEIIKDYGVPLRFIQLVNPKNNQMLRDQVDTLYQSVRYEGRSERDSAEKYLINKGESINSKMDRELRGTKIVTTSSIWRGGSNHIYRN